MKTLSRRRFLAITAASTASIPLAALTGPAGAMGHAKLDPEDAQAKALQYVHDSPKADQNCANCQLYTGAADADWGPCAIFPGKEVSRNGWCSAWVAKG